MSKVAVLLRLHSELLLASLAALVLGFGRFWPAFAHLHATGFGDWQMIHHNWEAAYVALRRFGEWPLWDPFHCGGITIVGNPESQLYAPLFWLSFATGTVIAVKVYLGLHMAAALLGMYLLARKRYALQPGPSAFAAVSWALSGWFAWHGAGGHATFLSFAFAPWIALAAAGLGQSPRYAVGCALLLVLTLLEGGTYPFPYFVLLLALEVGVRLQQSPARRAVLRDVGILVVLVGLTGAIRLVPIAMSLAENPRTVESSDWLSLNDVIVMLTARDHPWRFPPHPYVWPEYGSFFGWGALGLALAGVAWSGWRGPRHVLVGLLLFGAFMIGSPFERAPWALLHELPVYDSLRVPSRFAILFTFYLALLAAHALQALHSLVPSKRVAAAVIALLVVGQAYDQLDATAEVVDRWNGRRLSKAEPAQSFHLVYEPSYHDSYASYPRRNVGTRMCYVGGMDWKVAPLLWNGAQPQARIVNAKGKLLSSSQTTRTRIIQVKLQSPGRLLLNQNYASGWNSNVGKLTSDQGRLAVDLPAGYARVVLRYMPSYLWISALLSALGCALCVVIAWRRRA